MTALLGVILSIVAASGCSQQRGGTSGDNQLNQRAYDCLKYYVSYPHSALVRAQAIEAIEEVGGEPALPWIRQALHDSEPAVRFAAMLALGERRDAVAEPVIRQLKQQGQPSDRIAAVFALHRLGDQSHTAELAFALLQSGDLSNRSNAALVLGRLGEKSALPVLRRAMRVDDPGVRANVFEAMALLGDAEAIRILHESAYGGIGGEEAFAIQALGRLRDDRFKDLFRERLDTSLHLEAKLAAARSLGWLDSRAGFKLALGSMDFRATKDEKNDPAENQTFRVRQMAALALGAIGDRRAIPALERMLNTSKDPRLQVAAAKSILEIQG